MDTEVYLGRVMIKTLDVSQREVVLLVQDGEAGVLKRIANQRREREEEFLGDDLVDETSIYSGR
jgi:hypothetical protein